MNGMRMRMDMLGHWVSDKELLVGSGLVPCSFHLLYMETSYPLRSFNLLFSIDRLFNLSEPKTLYLQRHPEILCQGQNFRRQPDGQSAVLPRAAYSPYICDWLGCLPLSPISSVLALASGGLFIRDDILPFFFLIKSYRPVFCRLPLCQSFVFSLLCFNCRRLKTIITTTEYL